MFLTRFAYWGVFACCVVVGTTSPAAAQRANDNVLESAQDAFGTTVGDESIGLYTSRDVRGFDPVDAGNVRIEGLYFDRQAPNRSEVLVNSLVSSSAVRVGLSAQSYLFPAPTGIADLSLRMPRGKQVTSAVLSYGAYSRYALEINSQLPLIEDRLDIGFGGAYVHDDGFDGSTPVHLQGAVVAHWRPNDAIEVIPFWSRKNTDGWSTRPNIYTEGSYLPPVIPRHEMIAQPWSESVLRDSNFGNIVNASLTDNWRLRVGTFRSLVQRKQWHSNLFQNTRPDGTAEHVVIYFPGQSFGSYSGEVRLSGVYTAGAFRHTFHVAGRGRYVERDFNGADSRNLGRYPISPRTELPRPAYVGRPLSLDRVKQGTGGLAYEGIWAGVGEMSIGLQKTAYRRSLAVPNVATTQLSENPWLPNATLAVHATKDWTIFGSYTRGLEESGQAPNSATNRGEGLPSIRTTQVDAGVRYVIAPGVTAVGTLFEIKKPYLYFDTANLFTVVGNVRHSGFEFSLAGEVAEGLRVVAGAVLLKARISGPIVDQGRLGHVPIGTTPRFIRLDVEYGPKTWRGFSLDAQFDNRSSRVSSADNIARIPQRNLLNLGGRYRFKALDTDASLRVQVRNVFDIYAWDINVSQLAYGTEEPRRYVATLAVDF